MSGGRVGTWVRVRAYAVTAGIALVLVGSALVVGWFGIQDIGGDTSYGVRLWATAMIAISAYLLVSALAAVVVLLRGSAAAGSVTLVGGLVGALTGLALLTYQLINGDPTPWLGVWGLMTAAGVAVAIRLLMAGARMPYPRQFAVAVTATTVLGAASFAYSALYQPSAVPTKFRVEVDIGEPSVSADGTYASIPIWTSFINTGQVGLNVLTATYSVVGREGTVTAQGRTPEQMRIDVRNRGPAARWSAVEGYQLVQTDEFVKKGSVVQAGERIDVGRTVEIPLPTQLDTLGISATVLVARQDDLIIAKNISQTEHYSWDQQGTHRVDLPAWFENRGVDFVRYEVTVTETSHLREQTRQEWSGWIWRVLGDPSRSNPPGVSVHWRFAPVGSPLDVDLATVQQDNRLASDRYGITWGETGLYEESIHALTLSASLEPG